MTSTLSDIIVLDTTHVLAGPYCTQTLSALAATIIKVERPGTGDDTRTFPPLVDGEAPISGTSTTASGPSRST